MLLPDVNVLVYAFRADSTDHDEHRTWLDGVVNGDGAYACSDHVLAGFVRVVTHPRIFVQPDSTSAALAFAQAVRSGRGCVPVQPGPRHWTIFTRLCREANAKGNLVPDAYLAAIAIEHGCEFVTTDGDFARFPGLRWRKPIAR